MEQYGGDQTQTEMEMEMEMEWIYMDLYDRVNYQGVEGTKIITTNLNPRLIHNLGGSELTPVVHLPATIDHAEAYGPSEWVQHVPNNTSHHQRVSDFPLFPRHGWISIH